MPKLDIKMLSEQYPLINKIASLKEVTWVNPSTMTTTEGLSHVGLNESDVKDASERLARFAPLFAKAFPETQLKGGLIESELVYVDSMKKQLEGRYNVTIPGRLLLKKDSHLPISGSIKALSLIHI